MKKKTFRTNAELAKWIGGTPKPFYCLETIFMEDTPENRISYAWRFRHVETKQSPIYSIILN